MTRTGDGQMKGGPGTRRVPDIVKNEAHRSWDSNGHRSRCAAAKASPVV